MPNFNLFHFNELKKLLHDNKNGTINLSAEDEKNIRISMRNKLLNNKNDSTVNVSKPLTDDRYKKELKKDQLNNFLTDRLNSEIELTKLPKSIPSKMLIESPYGKTKSIDKSISIPLGIDLERGFKKVMVKK